MKIDKFYFQNARVGLFTHYTYATYADGKGNNWGGTWYSADNSRGAVSAEEAAALFDGDAYAQIAHALGAEYVVFTAAHAGFNLLFPSETMKRTGCTHKCTESSDVIAKLIAGLAPYGIPLVLYLPPNDAHDIKDAELAQMGWTDDAARMAFIKELICEIYNRYGKGVAGFWFDQCGPTADVCECVRACNPDAVIFINTGITGNTERHPLSDILVSEYYGSIEGCDSDTLPTHYSQVNRQIGNWWATGGKAPTDARNLYRYTVRTIATEGQYNAGIAWSCGPYLDQTWEDGVQPLLLQLGEFLHTHEGIFGTHPGKAYPTEPNKLLGSADWGVSTETPDGSVVYLHVMHLPKDGILHLNAPSDGTQFEAAEYQGCPLKLTAAEDGYTVVMPQNCDPMDTVIRLYRRK